MSNGQEPAGSDTGAAATATAAYAERLVRLQDARWKRLLDVQAPYRWHIRSLRLGRVLDVGCGIGRNLGHLDGNGVGVDHNPDMVAISRARGFEAYTSDAWRSAPAAVPASFDTLLLAHVVEHLTATEAVELVRTYAYYIKPGGAFVFVTPQERGYAKDPTHVRFADFAALDALCATLDLRVTLRRSFPFPRPVGRVFAYNEFVVVARSQ